MKIKMRTFTTACVALLMIGGLHATKAQANFVLGFEFNPDNMVEEPSLTIAPGVRFDVDILFEFTGGNTFPAPFSLDVTYDPAFVNVIDASFTASPPRPSSSPQSSLLGMELFNPTSTQFGVRSTTIGPFDSFGALTAPPLLAGSFVLGRLTLEGVNDTGQDTMTSLLGFGGFGGLLDDERFTVTAPNVGPSTLVVTAIPEPTTAWACLLLGSVGIASRRRRSVKS